MSDSYQLIGLVRGIQLVLRAKGFDPGPIDGLYGPRTEKAFYMWCAAETKARGAPPEEAKGAPPEEAKGAPRLVKGAHVRQAYDDFTGTVIGDYVTREGRVGVVVQQDGTKVVHVYGANRLLLA